MSEKEYYMAYEDFDRESHFPVGFFDDFKILKEKLFEKYKTLPYSMTGVCLIEVYKFKMNECCDFYDLEEIKEWWKKDG